MDEAEAAEPTAPRQRRRRLPPGLLGRLGRWLELGTEVRDAAVALLRDEARLARASLPWLALWLGLVCVVGVLFLATVWGGALLALYRWTGSVGQALLWLGASSAVLLALGAWNLRRLLQAATFAESRRRLGQWLERSEDDAGEHRKTADPGD